MFTHENPWQLQNTNFRTDLETSIYPQELSNHTIILFCNISERFNYFSPWILQHWLPSVNNASRYTDGSFFYKYWLFIKLQKMEGEVFIALGTSHGDFEPPRASISPQSPPSLKPAEKLLKGMLNPNKLQRQHNILNINSKRLNSSYHLFWLNQANVNKYC